MNKKIEEREISEMLMIFLVVQFSVIALLILVQVPVAVSNNSVVSVASGQGYNPFEVALGYGLYIAIGGALLWYGAKFFKIQKLLFRLFEALFIIGGTYAIFSIFTSNIAIGVVIGFCLVVLKSKWQGITNYCSVLASIGYGILFAVEFGFGAMLFFMIILAIYDFLAVYVTKHMVDMANTLRDIKNSLLVTLERQTSRNTVSSIRLGAADMFFPAALAGSLVLIGQPILAGVLALGGGLALDYLLHQVQKNLGAYPAIPYILGGMIGAGLIAVAVWSVV